MAYLTGQRFVHRDLAARNVLVATGMQCKVADFGLGRATKRNGDSGMYYKGANSIVAVRWSAPECLAAGGRFTAASDVWSFGLLVVEVFTDGGQPYPGMTVQEVLRRVGVEGYRHPAPGSCPAAVSGLMHRCCSLDPKLRPTFAQLQAVFQQPSASQPRPCSQEGAASPSGEHARQPPPGKNTGGDQDALDGYSQVFTPTTPARHTAAKAAPQNPAEATAPQPVCAPGAEYAQTFGSFTPATGATGASAATQLQPAAPVLAAYVPVAGSNATPMLVALPRGQSPQNQNRLSTASDDSDVSWPYAFGAAAEPQQAPTPATAAARTTTTTTTAAAGDTELSGFGGGGGSRSSTPTFPASLMPP